MMPKAPDIDLPCALHTLGWPRERSCAHATHPLALLRACRERPRDRRIAEKRYELAAF
jgi:hypothetical protein